MIMKLCGQTNKASAHPVMNLKKQVENLLTWMMLLEKI